MLLLNIFIKEEKDKMKKILSILLTVVLSVSACFALSSCGESADFTVGVCQLMVHDSLDKATQGFTDALTEELNKAGKTVNIDTQVAGEANLCTTVVNTFTAKINCFCEFGNSNSIGCLLQFGSACKPTL